MAHFCCRDMFKILGKYEVMIPEEDELKLEGLPHAWVTFQQCLIDSDAMLKKHKVCSFTLSMTCIYSTSHVHVRIVHMPNHRKSSRQGC